MTFMKEMYKFKKIFRDMEKATKKCVLMNGESEYIYKYILVKIL